MAILTPLLHQRGDLGFDEGCRVLELNLTLGYLQTECGAAAKKCKGEDAGLNKVRLRAI